MLIPLTNFFNPFKVCSSSKKKTETLKQSKLEKGHNKIEHNK